MVQKCWNKGPLGPSIPWGSFVLLYTNDPSSEDVKRIKEVFKGAKVVPTSEVKVDPEAREVPFDYAVVWSWT